MVFPPKLRGTWITTPTLAALLGAFGTVNIQTEILHDDTAHVRQAKHTGASSFQSPKSHRQPRQRSGWAGLNFSPRAFPKSHCIKIPMLFAPRPPERMASTP